jgi:flagellar FliL protein
MSTATADTAAAAPAPKGKKKLLIIVLAAVLVLGGAGGGLLWWMKAKAAAAAAAEEAEAEEGEEGKAKPSAKAKKDPKAVPTFVPLEPFTVNLADRNADRYAQVGVSLEVDDPKVADQVKAFMPAIRNNILMVLAHKTAEQLLAREGKEKLALHIQIETLRAMGLDVPAALQEKADEGSAQADAQADTQADAPKRKKAKAAAAATPITGVHFSNFIIQ